MFSSIIAPRRRGKNSLLASTFLVSTVLFAHPPSAHAQSILLPELLVTSPTLIPTPVNQVASSITVITAAEMERDQRRTVPDALSTVPGLNIIQTGGPGGFTSVFMRGTNPNHTKILIDGIDVSDPSSTNRQFDLGHLLTDDIERIEVLRGPQSGLYGADAIGGVISITTKKGEGPPRIVSLTEGGSFDTLHQYGSVSGSNGRFYYAFNASHFHSKTPVTPLDLLPPGRQRNDDVYSNWSYSSRLGGELSENLAVNWVGRYIDTSLRFTGDDFTSFPIFPDALQSRTLTHQFFTRGEAVVSMFDNRFQNFLGVALTDTWNWNKTPDTIFGPTLPTVDKGDRIQADWRGVLSVLPGQTVVMGLEYQTEELTTKTVRAENANRGAYVELQSAFADRFFIVANGRADDNDSWGMHETYRVAPAVIVPVTETKFKGSVGTGFKAPTLNQLFVDFPAFGFFANPNLLPEESFGYDVGFEQPVFGDRLRFGATWFHNDITNLIQTQFDTINLRSTLINIGQAETEGVESFAAMRLHERFWIRGDYTFTRAIDADTGLELLRRPRNKASIQAWWTPTDQLQLSATFLYVGAWVDGNRDFSIPRLTAPGYMVVNLAANYLVNENVKVFGRIDNLFNEQYQNPTGFERPGFGIYGGVRLASR
jgi:vitamin B12 transporter